MSIKNTGKAELVARVIGWALGVVMAAIVYTYLGLVILEYLGWLP